MDSCHDTTTHWWHSQLFYFVENQPVSTICCFDVGWRTLLVMIVIILTSWSSCLNCDSFKLWLLWFCLFVCFSLEVCCGLSIWHHNILVPSTLILVVIVRWLTAPAGSVDFASARTSIHCAPAKTTLSGKQLPCKTSLMYSRLVLSKYFRKSQWAGNL